MSQRASGARSRLPLPVVLLPMLVWVGTASLLSWSLTHVAYRALDIDFGHGREALIADWAPLVLPLLIAPLTTLPRIRLQQRLALANEQLRGEVERGLRLQEELRHQACHDPLTGVLNRRGFFEQAARFDGQEAVLLLCDLDGFKAINDVHGHAVGDLALQAVAEVLCQRCGDGGGLVGRLGGDEFVAVLPAWRVHQVHRVRDDLQDLPVVGPGGAVLRIRASVGLTHISGVDSVEAGLAAADGAMYARKRALPR